MYQIEKAVYPSICCQSHIDDKWEENKRILEEYQQNNPKVRIKKTIMREDKFGFKLIDIWKE